MKQKSIYLMAAALLIGSNQILMTGCQKDYDGQIEMLKNQIQSGNVNIDALLQKIELIEKQIATLQEAAKEHAELKDKINQLIAELNATKTDLQQQIDVLKKALEDYDLNVKEMIADAEKRFDEKLNALSQRIDKEIGEKYNELKEEIQDLNAQVETMRQTYDKLIADLTKRIKALENNNAPQANIDELKKQLAELQKIVDNNIKEIQELKDNQTVQAQKLVELEEKVNQYMISMNANYNKLSSRVDELFKLYEDLLKQIPDLGELKASVAKHEKEIADLQLKYQELNGKLDGFVSAEEVENMLSNYYNKAEIDKLLADMYNKLDQAPTMSEVKRLIEEATKGIQSQIDAMQGKVDELKKLVEELQAQIKDLNNQVEAMKQTYDKLIADLTKRIEALEHNNAPQANIDELKKQLAKLQKIVDNNIKEIQGLKDNQTAQAQKLVELEEKVNQYMISMNANYNKLNGRVDELFKLYEDLLKQIPDLGELKASVAKHEKEIADLQLKYQDLNGKLNGFVSAEEVEKMLSNFYNKAEIDKLLADMYNKLNQAPTMNDVQRLIEEVTRGIQSQIDAMQGKVDGLKKQVEELQAQVEQLFKRIQSLVVIPQYTKDEVDLSPLSGNKYELTVNVKVNPANALNDMIDLKNYFHIDAREAIVNRAAGDAGPAFTVTKVMSKDATQGIFTIKASCQLPNIDPTSHTMPFTVAVEFKNETNNRSTGYHAVRFVPANSVDQTPYIFKSGEEVIKTRPNGDLSQFNANNTYQRKVLGKVNNVNGKELIQIIGNNTLFTPPVLATSQKVNSNKNIPVFYNLEAIYDEKGMSHIELGNYIQVNNTDGSLSMKNNLTAGVTTSNLTGYKIVLRMQARQNGNNYGEPAYTCIELQQK